MHPEILKDLRHNMVVNILDGGFFGFSLGFASFVTILPLFVSTMTDSAILIGLIPAIHSMGWQLPQLLTASRVARQKRFKPMVMYTTIQERLPFVGLAITAALIPVIGKQAALWITFVLLIWQGLGGGFTATAWQSMIAKIIPSDRRGTFYGVQSAAANLMASLSAVAAGYILDRLESPLDFVLCFSLASFWMIISWSMLAMTREPETDEKELHLARSIWHQIKEILALDTNFRWFLIARMLSQFAIMGFSFYTVYSVKNLGMNAFTVGILTSVFVGTQIIINPLMGWVGDHWQHRYLMIIGLLSATASGLLAWKADSSSWFYLIFMLAGVANVAIWTIGLTMIFQFGNEAQRPAYIGLANTLIAPSTILAPFIGGWLAEISGYQSAFLVSAAAGIITAIILQFALRDPQIKLPAPSMSQGGAFENIN